MASQSSSPNVPGPLAGMFTTAAQQAIIAEEAADLLTQEQNIERATIAAAAATAAAAAETEATASALLGSVGLPVQQRQGEVALICCDSIDLHAWDLMRSVIVKAHVENSVAGWLVSFD